MSGVILCQEVRHLHTLYVSIYIFIYLKKNFFEHGYMMSGIPIYYK